MVLSAAGGFRELCLPVAQHLGVPKEHVFANRMQWQLGDDTGGLLLLEYKYGKLLLCAWQLRFEGVVLLCVHRPVALCIGLVSCGHFWYTSH